MFHTRTVASSLPVASMPWTSGDQHTWKTRPECPCNLTIGRLNGPERPDAAPRAGDDREPKPEPTLSLARETLGPLMLCNGTLQMYAQLSWQPTAK